MDERASDTVTSHGSALSHEMLPDPHVGSHGNTKSRRQGPSRSSAKDPKRARKWVPKPTSHDDPSPTANAACASDEVGVSSSSSSSASFPLGHPPPGRASVSPPKSLPSDAVPGAQAQAVASMYSRIAQQHRDAAVAPPRKAFQTLNNAIKAWLISALCPPAPFRVLDLCCGRGGDMHKWVKAGAGLLIGLDSADGAVAEARTRFAAKTGHRCRAKYAVADCFAGALVLPEGCGDAGFFDVVGCMFAAHYAFASAAGAARLMATVARALRPGGVFLGTVPDAAQVLWRAGGAGAHSNGVYSLQFKGDPRGISEASAFGHAYEFHLQDHVDRAEEYVVLPEVFEALAAAEGLVPVPGFNFVNFGDVVQQLPPLPKGATRWWDMPAEERELATLYCTFAFRKT